MACDSSHNRDRYNSGNLGNWSRGISDFSKRGRKNTKHDLVRLLRNEKGSTNISLLAILPLLLFIVFVALTLWGTSTAYENTESNKYFFLTKMSINGGLTPDDKQKLIANLTDAGADPNTIRISGDLVDNGVQPVYWPNELKLKIQYEPLYFNDVISRTVIEGNPLEPVKIGVKGSIISEKVKPADNQAGSNNQSDQGDKNSWWGTPWD